MRRLTDILVTAIAPLVWGTNFLLTTDVLPPGRPLLDSLVRSLPIGLLIVAFSRQLPKGDWWWKSAVLAALNFGAFFPLLFFAAYHLPGSVASMLGAAAPVFVVGLAWGMLGARPAAQTVGAAGAVLVGLALLLGPSVRGIDPLGVGAALAATAIMAVATVLLKKWGPPPVKPIVLAGWQLSLGGVMLLPFALLEGPLPDVTLAYAGGYLYLGLIGTALAYACWFRGVERLSPVASTLIAALNPIVAIALGVAFNHERLSLVQGIGVAIALGAIALGQDRDVRKGGAKRASIRSAVHSAPAVLRSRHGRHLEGSGALLRADVTDQLDDELRARVEPARIAVGDVELLRPVEAMVREREVGARPDAVAAAARRGSVPDDPAPADRE
jgi:probable blue pigment (indigoidine) exporter